MQLTQKMLKRINIFSPGVKYSGYYGSGSAPEPLGFVYAQVVGDKTQASEERRGCTTDRTATLLLRPEAGVKCGDLAGVYGDKPDSRIVGITRYPGHITARTERI